MTQEQFDAMMADYLARRGREKPSDWSENARRWAEEAGLVSGDSAGMRYRDFTTREETIQFLYRYQQVTEGKPSRRKSPLRRKSRQRGLLVMVSLRLSRAREDCNRRKRP